LYCFNRFGSRKDRTSGLHPAVISLRTAVKIGKKEDRPLFAFDLRTIDPVMQYYKRVE
jgi:hypothetical protein